MWRLADPARRRLRVPHFEGPWKLSPSAVGSRLVTRRDVLRTMLGFAGLAAVPALGACGRSGPAAGAADTVTVGSNYSDAVPKEALAEVFSAFSAKTGIALDVNTVDHNTFQQQANNYLQGRPGDVFAWFAGYRMRFFAERELASPISDVWEQVGGNFSQAFREASTGRDGEQYFIPFYYYPWAVFYRKSLFQQRGYEVPANLNEFTTLAERMQQDGIVPIAFANKDGWPAMGTLDYLNMRINGFDFHMRLMEGQESWESDEVKAVFSTWRDLLPFHQQGALGRTWQEAAQALAAKEAGMYVLGMFLGQQFSEADREDLEFFAFPEINPQFGQDSVEAPIDGFMLSKNPRNPDGAKQLLAYLATPEAQSTYLRADPNNVAATEGADTSGYGPLQLKALELVSGAAHVSQFLDRDTRPDFASTVMIPSLQEFFNDPDGIDRLTRKIEQQKRMIFG
jgi:multiple sugar transport system substrate-binding protein